MMEKYLSDITENLKRIRANIEDAAVSCGRNPLEISLMAVTKTVPPERVNFAVSQGITLLGENRAQELMDKYDAYHKEQVDIHFIGHLQTNKVKYIVGKVSTVQSVSSLKLASEISRLSEKAGLTTNLLIEINVGGEESKSGIAPQQVESLIREISSLKAVRVCGLMAIPPICANPAQAEGYFSQMHSLMVDIKGKNIDNISMDYLSMGMSGDYTYAIKHGANIIRLGSAIFGSRG